MLATPKPGADVFLGYAIIETAINTFVDGDSHRMFESDTDLAYPPDLRRFLNFPGSTFHVGIAYCEALSAAAVRHADLPDFGASRVELAIKAGNTDFKFITEKARTADKSGGSFFRFDDTFAKAVVEFAPHRPNWPKISADCLRITRMPLRPQFLRRG